MRPEEIARPHVWKSGRNPAATVSTRRPRRIGSEAYRIVARLVEDDLTWEASDDGCSWGDVWHCSAMMTSGEAKRETANLWWQSSLSERSGSTVANRFGVDANREVGPHSDEWAGLA